MNKPSDILGQIGNLFGSGLGQVSGSNSTIQQLQQLQQYAYPYTWTTITGTSSSLLGVEQKPAEPRKETNLEWLDRRVNEIRVRL